MPYRTAFIVGAGPGLSASLARVLHGAGLQVALGARDTQKLRELAAALGATTVAIDAAHPESVRAAFRSLESSLGAPDAVFYNAGHRLRGAFVNLDPEAVREALAVTAYGGFLVAQEAVRGMLSRGSGALFFTGASASIKGYAQSAPFAMGKFALRGLAQSLAREFGPQGIHVAHFIIDGGIASPARAGTAQAPDALLDPDAIARTYLHVLQQDRSAWSFELDLRPWVERF
jgi:NAD(P)-dependent dehydrogenase (short-subunit alcohol dehydrogenase family)